MRNYEISVSAFGRAALGMFAAAVALSPLSAFAQHEGHDMGKMSGARQKPNMAPQSQQNMMQSMMRDVQELRALKGNDRERTFLTKMMDHHQSGIDMAKMAVEKSQNPAIVKEAKKIIADQTKEIGEMRQHLSSAHQVNRTAKPDPRMQPMMQKLEGLTGTEFDKAFAQDMIMHHQGAIDMAQVVTSGGVPHKTVSQLAQKTIQGNKRSQAALRKAI